jgi:hypothetical protein
MKVLIATASNEERAVMRALRVAEGDCRDWDEIRAWATSIAGVLVPAPRCPTQDAR